MLANFEARLFHNGEKVWLGRYRGLTNVLHWHLECELIYIINGTAQIKVEDTCFSGTAGDIFFCSGEQLHYILGSSSSEILVIIFSQSISKSITDRCCLSSPKLPSSSPFLQHISSLENTLKEKGTLYRERLETIGRLLLLDIFSTCPTKTIADGHSIYNDLILKIHKDYSFITFRDVAKMSGYSQAHFSKMFKKLSGMTFTDYLNKIRIENAITMLRADKHPNVTAISRACGFTTIRNFNHVFRNLTGYAPTALPGDYVLDIGVHTVASIMFDPTDTSSVLISQT